jgi:hypothetical protein
MSEPRHVALASTSNAEDAAWLAVADVAGIATDLGIDYRLIGGNSVALLVQVHDAATQVPGRATAEPTWAPASRSAQIHAWCPH